MYNSDISANFYQQPTDRNTIIDQNDLHGRRSQSQILSHSHPTSEKSTLVSENAEPHLQQLQSEQMPSMLNESQKSGENANAISEIVTQDSM